MSWLNRLRGVTTASHEKKEVPGGIWKQCSDCGEAFTAKEILENLWVCPNCNYHLRIDSREYFSMLFDESKPLELFSALSSKDFLGFTDLKPYKKRLEAAKHKSGYKDAINVETGHVNGHPLLIACMNFSFIGGSMGSVVGEKISRSVDYCIEHKLPLLIISKSGGARMMESAFSLMQMAKTAAKLSQLSRAGLPYISLMTDPTTGGVSASFAMLGDFNIAEPKALIGFAGPRVIRETIKKDLPEGFQRSEFLLDKGFLDFIVQRKDLKQKIADILTLLIK